MEAFIVFRKDGKIVAMANSVEASVLAKQENLYDEMYWCVPEKVKYTDGGFYYAIER